LPATAAQIIKLDNSGTAAPRLIIFPFDSSDDIGWNIPFAPDQLDPLSFLRITNLTPELPYFVASIAGFAWVRASSVILMMIAFQPDICQGGNLVQQAYGLHPCSAVRLSFTPARSRKVALKAIWRH
jgi:hypothetical protein